MRALLIVGAFALAGCSGGGLSGDAKAVHEMCVKYGGTPVYCDCMVKTLQAKLPKEQFAKLVEREDQAMNGNLEAITVADAACPKS